MEEHSRLYKLRHSLAHVLAQAVLDLRPNSKLGFGPPADNGFYYDFILSEVISEEDFPIIEKKMKEIIRAKQKFSREELSIPDAMKRIEKMGEPYKLEYAQELAKKQELKKLSFYTNGPFLDMCEGPHVENTSEIPLDCFRIRSIAGAYWRGDSNNKMMTRIYAFAFEDKKTLQEYIKAYELALQRDHKKLGKELHLYKIDEEVGKGLPLWLPHGTVIRDELEKYVKELEFRANYQRVSTPHIAKAQLYERTGHLPYYADQMYPAMEVEEKEREEKVKESYILRPMNCPHHHLIFNSSPRSYRDLPFRLAEYGQVYRYEESGALSGLLRVRGLCQNDAHIYCTEEQVEEEFLAVMEMHKELYETLAIKDYYMRFSCWDPEDPKGKEKYVDNPEAWEKTQKMIRQAMDKSKLPYVEVKGEAAFYGPKIDFQLKTVTGREESISTAQLDFAIPVRLALTYTDKDNTEKTPYCIHRAPQGTHERFVAFLIEKFGGAFPTWLAPVQVRVLVVSDRFYEYAEKLVSNLRKEMLRVEMDKGSETMGKKIRSAVKEKIPNVLIIGEREVKANEVTLRCYGEKEQRTMKIDAFKAWLLNQVQTRALPAREL